jgi:hypothetical protein
VHAFFSRQFSAFFKYQFQKLTLSFDNRDQIEIRKSSAAPELFPDASSNEPSEEAVYVALESATQPQQQPHRITVASAAPAFHRYLPFLSPNGVDSWVDDNSNEIISSHEVVVRYGTMLPANLRRLPDIPEWLGNAIDSTECRLIETQRLLRLPARDEEVYRSGPRRHQPAKPVVEVEARDLAMRIGKVLGDSANRSQVLDQSFPKRVIAALGSEGALEAEDLTARLIAVDKKRSQLIDAGLLDKAGAPEILTPAERTRGSACPASDRCVRRGYGAKAFAV